MASWLANWGVLASAQLYVTDDFVGYTCYWLKKRLALYFSLTRKNSGQSYLSLLVGFALIPEENADIALVYLLRENASLHEQGSLCIELQNLVAFRFTSSFTCLNANQLSWRLPWIIEAAQIFQSKFTKSVLTDVPLLLPLPDAYFQSVGE